MEPFSILIALAVVSTIVTLLVRVETDKKVARRKKLLRAAPTYEILDPHIALLNEGQSRLNEIAYDLPGFTLLGEIKENYPQNSGFSNESGNTFRVFVDAERTTSAIMFRMGMHLHPYPGTLTYFDRIPRLALITTLSDGRWIETQRDFELPGAHPVAPAEMDLARFDWEIPIGELIEKHLERVKSFSAADAGYRDKASATRVPIESIQDFLSDHRRRWEIIREHQPQLRSRS